MIRATRPPTQAVPRVVRDPGIVEGYLEDASGAPPGSATGLLRVVSEAEASALLRATLDRETPILCQAARTSLTGGAIPHGELILSVERMNAIGRIEPDGETATVRVEPGVRLDTLGRELAKSGWYYPPVPTYQQAMIGGTVATNAGGAATFKYGVTRHWVRAVRVMLFNGDVVELERGQATASPGEHFSIVLSDGCTLAVPVPSYRLPPIKKISAGYHAAQPLDLVDLFVGSEGTLGLIVSITLELVRLPASVVTGLVFPQRFDDALKLAAALRDAALAARREGDSRGPDIRAIESVDANGVDLLRSSGDARRLRINLPDRPSTAVLFEMELPRSLDNDTAQRLALRVLDGDDPAPGAQPLSRLFHLLAAHGALGDLEFAFPEDDARRTALFEFREAVPRRVNELLAQRRRADPGIKKVAGDLIVPFDRLGELVPLYEQSFSRRGLDYAIWGHLSDGNLHPNGLARSTAEVKSAVEAVFECAEHTMRAGGCPLSEHGVGRDPVKQELLRRFVGDESIRQMRQVKDAIDPPRRFGRGVLFPAEPVPANS
jgi:D-lactate dehydrogenase (cytochrome)